jgi:glycosyltransferase involved in cell wall biosynthesis
VRVTGIVPTENIAEIMNSIDIMLAVYQSAPLGSAAMGQVLSLGRPVIASTVASFMEINQAAGCLRLIPPNCPFELAEAILALIDDHPERMRLHASALAFAQRHSFAALAQQVLNGQ